MDRKKFNITLIKTGGTSIANDAIITNFGTEVSIFKYEIPCHTIKIIYRGSISKKTKLFNILFKTPIIANKEYIYMINVLSLLEFIVSSLKLGYKLHKR